MAGETKITEESVRDALRRVLDPEIGLDVVSMGLIRGIDLESTPPEVKMVLTTPFCPLAASMTEQVKTTVEKVVGAEVKVELLRERWRPDMMDDPSKLGF